jgi:D-beta-D-heptose 7-phosphate kinase/D-beta-D-heptose 1-phosphate adenosyltransferase
VGEIVKRELLRGKLESLKKDGAKVVFTNGCFDLLHRGHVEYLKEARKLGDVLVVGLNSDSSVRRLKGKGRPYVAEEDRGAILAALNSVDYVCVFDEDTPLELIKELKPSVLVKGRDYELSAVVGAKEVEGWGGEVRLVDLVPGRSTTDLAERVARIRGKA